jgi:hypothetical protein
MSGIERLLEKQKQREAKEAEALQRSIWNLKPIEEQIAFELLNFLNRELPNTESYAMKFHLYELSSELQEKFRKLLIEKGLLKI